MCIELILWGYDSERRECAWPYRDKRTRRMAQRFALLPTWLALFQFRTVGMIGARGVIAMMTYRLDNPYLTDRSSLTNVRQCNTSEAGVKYTTLCIWVHICTSMYLVEYVYMSAIDTINIYGLCTVIVISANVQRRLFQKYL